MTMSKIIFGIDVGGTTCKCGTFSEEGELLRKEEIPTRKDEGGSLILPDISEYIKGVLADMNMTTENVAGIGMGLPGACLEDGTVNKCINLGWGVFNAANALSELTGIPVKIGNDANMAALGEFCVGGGVIIDGKPLYGFNGAAGEIGHLPLVEGETESCNCGKKGCLEQVASATGIVRTANRMLAESDMPSSLRSVPYISAKVIFDEAKGGDALAIQVTEYVCRYLGKGLACAAGMVDPEVFVIGGGVSAAGEYFINLIDKYYKECVFHASRQTKIVKAALGNDAGMYGAAKLILGN